MEITSKNLTSLTIDGALVRLSPSDMTDEGQGSYTTRVGDLLLELTVTAPAEGAFTTLLRITNEGITSSPRIRDVRSFDVAFPASKALFEGLTGDACGADSYVPYTRELTAEPYVMEPTGGRSSSVTAFPCFDVTADGATYVFGIGWTGQWRAELDCKEGSFRLSVGLADCDFYLNPAESVRFPLTLCVMGNNPLAARQSFRRILREHFSPQAGREDELLLPIAIQAFDRYFAGNCGTNRNPLWNTEAGQIAEIDALDAIPSMDTVWLDAAWFTGCFPMGVGNYSFVEGFPNGLRKVTDYAREKGKKFLLWFEPERVVFGTETERAHPEFLLRIPEIPDTGLYNLADPVALAYLTALIGDFIRREGIDIYRQDANIAPLPFWRAADTPDRRGVTEMHYVEGLYKLWDDLRARFPGMLIDNCSSGGRRLDIEALSRSVSLWRSDTGCFPEHEGFATSVWNTQQVMSLARYLPYASVGNWVNAPYDVRSTGTAGIACNYDVLNPDFDFATAEAILSEVARVRPLWNGDFYSLTEIDIRDDTWAAYQLHRGGMGAVYAFRKKNAETETFSVRLHAIDPAATYAVRLTDEAMTVTETVLSGEALTDHVFFAPAPRSSILLEYSPL